VILISLTFTATKQSINRLEDNYYDYLEEQQIEHFQFNLASIDINHLGATAIYYLCDELGINFECYYNLSIGTKASYSTLNHLINAKIDEQPDKFSSIIDDYVSDLENDYDITVEKKNFSDVVDGVHQYRFTNVTETINIPYLVAGELPKDDYDIAVFPEYAEKNDIELLDTLTINNVDYKVTGFFYSPDYAFPIYYMNSMNPETDSLILTTHSTMELLDNYIDRKYIGRGSLEDILDAKTLKEVNESEDSILGKTTQVKNVKPATRNYAISTLTLEVENANIFIDAFIVLFIGFISLLLTVFLKRYIHKNKKDIETLQSLGYKDSEITKSLMVFPVIISLMSIVGFLIGLLISNPLFNIYSERYLFPKADFTIYTDILVYAILLPMIFINLISFIFIRLSLLKDKKKSPKVKLRLFKFTPIKTVISTFILLISVSTMVIFGLNGNSMFSAFAEETRLGNNYDEMLFLDYYTDDPLEEKHEPISNTRGKITHINSNQLDKNYGLRIYGINPSNDLKLLVENDAQNNLLLEDGVIISAYTQYNTGVKIGDEITISIQDQDLVYEIKGISNELIENNMFMNITDLNEVFNLDNTSYNGVFSFDDTYESEHIIKRVDYNQGLQDILNILTASSVVINFVLILSVFISIFVFMMILINYLADNRLNISILKSIGFNNKEINTKYVLLIYIIFIISFILAIPLTRLVFDLLLHTLINSLGYILLVNINTMYIVIGFVFLNIIFVITIYFINKYYETVSISETLKHNIK